MPSPTEISVAQLSRIIGLPGRVAFRKVVLVLLLVSGLASPRAGDMGSRQLHALPNPCHHVANPMASLR